MIALKDKFSYFLEGTNGKTVLLIHGLTGIPAEMKFVARILHRAGYNVYAPLLAGHGIDKETLTKSRWQDWLESIYDAVAALRGKTDAIYTAGICVGGKLGMLAAHQLQGIIAATAIYSPCFRFDGWNVPWYYKLAPVGLPVMAQIPGWKHKSFSETESVGIKDERLRKFMQGADAKGVIEDFPVASLLEMYRLGKALKNTLPVMTTPALILHAEEDDLSHPRNAKLIASTIGAPHRLHWINDSYHMIHVDAQHQAVAKMTADFFHAPLAIVEAGHA